MPPPMRPINDLSRVAALQASGLLETGENPDLDALVRQAALMFNTPIAAITLLDGTHQHFKASLGLGVSRTSRDEAFCGYAILESEPLIVLDTQLDRRFADNPLVTNAPAIRFYAGVPVYGPGGLPFGALCVIDPAKRSTVDDALIMSLRDMAGMVSSIFSKRSSRR